MQEHRRTGAEQRSARAAGVQYAHGDTELDTVDDKLVRYASSAYDQIDALLHETNRPMPPALVYAVLGNLHALVQELPLLLAQLSGGLQQAAGDLDHNTAARVDQVTRFLAEAETVAAEFARRLTAARSAADDHTRAHRLAGPRTQQKDTNAQ